MLAVVVKRSVLLETVYKALLIENWQILDYILFQI